MIAIGVTSNDVLAAMAVAAFFGGIGAAIGRKWTGTKKHREAEETEIKRRREVDEKADAARDAILQELTWAVVGKPPDQWSPEGIPGVIEKQRTFENTTAEMFKKLLDRADRPLDPVVAATASAAVLETASQAAQTRKQEEALSAAKVLEVAATALAEQLKKAHTA